MSKTFGIGLPTAVTAPHLYEKGYIAFIRKMRYDITDLNGVKNIEPKNVMQL
jgi:hypothetical protein